MTQDRYPQFALSSWRSLVRKALPPPIRAATRWYLRRSFRYKKNRESSTDYLTEFDHSDLDRAKASILWFEDWDRATRNHVALMEELGLIRDGFIVVDYGCGIGRVTAAISRAHQVKVIAVDRSNVMLQHAREYIAHELIDSGRVQLMTDRDFLDRIAAICGTADSLLFIEVLQHIPEPILDSLLPQVVQALKPDGRLFVFGNSHLDVSSSGREYPDTPRVIDVLDRHVDVIGSSVWAHGFSAARYAYLCKKREVR